MDMLDAVSGREKCLNLNKWHIFVSSSNCLDLDCLEFELDWGK